MLQKMDKTDKKRTDFKGKKSAKKFKKAGKQKISPGKPEQTPKNGKQLIKQEDSKNSTETKMGAKIEKNKKMMNRKKEMKGKIEDGGQKGDVKERKGGKEKGDRQAQWKKKGASGGKKHWQKGKPAKKDDRPKLEEMSKKDRKLLRRQESPNYELSVKAKKIWEKLREHSCTGEAREKLLVDLYDLIKGRAKELVRAHDTVRVLECCMQYGSEQQKQEVFNEVKDITLELCKSTYGKFFVLKVLKYGNRQQRNYIIQCFYGQVCKLVQHSVAAEVVETAYNNWANAHQRSALLEEFYGAKFAVFKESGVHTLEDILTKQPDSVQTIMEHMLKIITPMLEKSVIKHTIVHKVIADFLIHASMKMKTELIQLMREVIVQILHTNDGAKAGMYCFWFGTTKDRKHMIKSFKTFVTRICKEEYGHRVLLALFDSVDDTKLVSKVIIEEMMLSASEIAHDQHGRKVLLYLMSPRNRAHFHPDIIKRLEIGDNNPNSKKDTKVRREELLAAASPALLELVAEETKEMVTNKSLSQLMLVVLEFCKGDKSNVFQEIADIAAEDFVPTVTDSEDNLDSMHIVEHPAGHFLLRCLLKQESTLLKSEPDTPVLFSDILLKTVSAENLKSWIGTNRSAFVLVNLIKSPRDEVRQQVKDALQPVMKSLKNKSTQGCQNLLQMLTT